MSNATIAFIVTIIMGVVGVFLGANFGLQGYLGTTFAVATMGAFIISAIEKTKKNTPTA